MIFKLYFEAVLETRLLNYVANIVNPVKEVVTGDDPFGHGHAINKDSDEESEEEQTHHEGGEKPKKMTGAQKR